VSTLATRSTGSSIPADLVLGDILKEIAVPNDVLEEAKRRRNVVLQIAMTVLASGWPGTRGVIGGRAWPSVRTLRRGSGLGALPANTSGGISGGRGTGD
jgi:hypothetical protein